MDKMNAGDTGRAPHCVQCRGSHPGLVQTCFRQPPFPHSVHSVHSVQKPLRSAFSLIEIVLALGIISFALVGIIGLFPVAMKSALESQRETRAAQIAQQIFSDLKALPATNTLIATNTDILASQLRLSLAANSSNLVSYSQDGLPLGSGTNPDAIYLAAITVATNVPVAGLSRVQATIETPASAASTNRSRYTFVTLMNQR